MKSQKLFLVAVSLIGSLSVSSAAMAASKDATWIKSAASANMLEIKAGQLAASRSTTPSWKTFGQQMVKDHTGALAGIMSLAKDKSVMVPSHMAPPDAAAYAKLKAAHGKAFDASYSKFAVMSHTQANGLYNSEINNGKDSDVRAVAAKQLPTVQNHLAMADKMTGMGMSNMSKGDKK